MAVENTKQLLLQSGNTTVVDEWILPLIKNFRWYEKQGYAATNTKKGKNLKLHKFIMWCPEGLQIDHINGDKLDNRLENLRIATPSQNQANSYGRKRRSSEYKGVTKYRNRWVAQIQKNKNKIHIGVFDTEKEAALAYDSLAKKLFKEYANTNF